MSTNSVAFIPNKPLFYKVIGVWLVSLAGLISFAAYFDVFEAPRHTLEVLTTANWLVLMVLMAFALPKGIWSISFIFFAAFGVFHGGLIMANAFEAITDEDIQYQISFWFFNVETENAIHLVNLGMTAFCLAAMILSKSSILSVPPQQSSDVFNRRMFHMGGLVLMLMVGIFFALSISLGVIQSYGAYLNLLSMVPIYGTIYAYIYLLIGLGLVVVSVSYRPGFGWLYFAVFAVWALVAFKLGLRGEVMFPGTVAACMLGRRMIPIKTPTLIVLVLVFLVATGIVKNARISGDYSAVDSINPLNAVAEMGSSLRAVQEVIKWRKQGDDLLLGGSYWAPIERQLALIIPGLNRRDVKQDPRLLNIVVQERAGPIGFSPVAEAYINFGEKGVVFIFALLGAIMATLDNRPSRVRFDHFLGVALVPVFIMIRNSFTHVPVQIILGMVLVWGMMFVASSRIDMYSDSNRQ
ncbi:O-antigen polysaccharide polymerase Wzy [Alteromonas oceanisediminis]|uniref:O-antigen polysaccharide polymerase Wzy n=1 Tax=Alteromonas oceanisediminis TaxID=2836180 RepID=UPI001BD9A120|nr:O-antigen polysaccharide polymerase Wzy [Alteromonas oceanisediminis]MBT0587779.1 O-antigen polysaccharide polymerase Wzy [Alteromonas oceanisediminis]